MTIAAQAVELIKKNGAMYSPDIERLLNTQSIASSLKPLVDNGTLVVCKVTRPGDKREINQYRLSAAVGGRIAGRISELCRAKPAAPAEAPQTPPAPAEAPQTPPAAVSPRIGAIEKGIPFPSSKRGSGELRVQISQMQVGNSFLTSYSDSACYSMARKLGMKVISRPEGEAGDIRVWRTE